MKTGWFGGLAMRLVFTAVCAVFAANVMAQDRSFGNWRYAEKKDKFDDTDRSFIFVASDAGRSMAVMRMEDGINIVYNWNSYMGGDKDKDVTVRYRVQGQQASQSEYWRLLQGHKAAFAPMNRVQGILREFGAGLRCESR